MVRVQRAIALELCTPYVPVNVTTCSYVECVHHAGLLALPWVVRTAIHVAVVYYIA